MQSGASHFGTPPAVPDASNVEDQRRILNHLAYAGQEAVRYDVLQRELGLDPRVAAAALRSLLESGKVCMRRGNPAVGGGATKGVAYISLTSSLPEGVASVLDAVRNAGRRGIDQVSICSTLRLAKTEVTKALHQLMQQQRIKDIRDFSNKAKRKYMLFELEPSEEVTGGTFYNELREIDVPYVDRLRHSTALMVANRGLATLDEIVTALQNDQQQLGGKQMSRKDAETLVQTLELDGVLECVFLPGHVVPHYQVAIGKNVFRHFAAMNIASLEQGATAVKVERSEDGVTSGASSVDRARGGPQVEMVPAVSPYMMPGLTTASTASHRHQDPSSVPLSVEAALSHRTAAMALTGFPCIGCPQLASCSAAGQGIIKPQNCAYLNTWLDF